MMLNYYRPDNLNDGLVALSEDSWTLLAGGTDFYPARVGKNLNEKISFIGRFRRFFFTGFLVTAPILITLYVTWMANNSHRKKRR